MVTGKTTRHALKYVKTIPSPPARPGDAHKGTFGKVLVIGGSSDLAGAPALVGLAALRSGAGLVTIGVPGNLRPAMVHLCPCATTISFPITMPIRPPIVVPIRGFMQIDPAKSLSELRRKGWLTRESAPSALVVGPGIGPNNDQYGRQLWKLINAFRNEASVPTVIDADALNLARKSTRKAPNAWNCQPHFRTIITPHPGEMARLHGVTTKEVQADRVGYAVRTAHMMAGNRFDPDHTPVVVLKGAGTIVTDGHRVYINRTGNPGMATGGSGDVLAGVLGGLIAQGMDVFDAAVLGVHVHGLAGDRAAEVIGQISMIATDLINCLPVAFEEMTK